MTVPDFTLSPMSAPLITRPALDPRPAAHSWQRIRLDSPLTDPLPLEPTQSELGCSQPGPRAGTDAPGVPRQLRTFAEALVRAIIEVIQGRRPVSQLVRWVDEPALAEIALRARHHRADARLTMCTVHLRQQHQAIEVAARVRAGRRSSAIAIRLVRLGNRWLCSDIDFGPAPPGLPLRP